MTARFARGPLALALLIVFLILAVPGLGVGDAPAAPLAQAACSPVGVTTAPTAVAGQLQVTVDAGASAQELRFGEPRPSTNERVTFPGGPTGASGIFQVPWPTGQTVATFTLGQQTLGQPATAQLVVRRAGCPDWPTLAGGGTTAFGSPTPTRTGAAATATMTPASTATITVTPTATATRTATSTSTPTRTPTASPSPTATTTPQPGCV